MTSDDRSDGELDQENRQNLAEVSKAILEMVEGLPFEVEAFERAEEKEPAPINGLALRLMRDVLEKLYADLRDLRRNQPPPPVADQSGPARK